MNDQTIPHKPGETNSGLSGLESLSDSLSESRSLQEEEERRKKKEEEFFSAPGASIQSLRTFRGDVAGMVKSDNVSLVKIVLEEQKAKRKEKAETSPTTGKNLTLMILSLIFFTVSTGIVYFAFFFEKEDSVLKALKIEPLIFVEKNKEIPVSGLAGGALLSKVADEILRANLSLDTIQFLFFTKKLSLQTKDGIIEETQVIGAPEFFSLLGLNIPSVLRRSIDEEFMLGVHSFNENNPFLIIKTDLFENTFAGMLEWENVMATDLLPLFGAPYSRELDRRPFHDVLVKNKDTRMLRDVDGIVYLVYMFKDRETLIIATNEDTLLEISRRLDLSKEKFGK